MINEDFKFELNYQGVGELLHSDAMANLLNSLAEEHLGELGNGYKIEVKNMGTRLIAVMSANTKETNQDNLENNTLLREFG